MHFRPENCWIFSLFLTFLVHSRDAYAGKSHFNLVSFVRTMAVIYTIDSINNSTFLPGVRLGYTICDTCSDASIALQATEKLLAINGTLLNQCYLSEQPAVKVIIGSRYSEESIVMARLLKLYMMPQISTTSSAAILSDRHRFPSFLRTIPSDIHQTFALAQLMAHFDWNWVGVVSSDDDYGKDALQSFLAEAAKANVCTDFQDVVPYNLNDINSRRRIQEVADHINASNAKVVLLILKEELVQKIFEEMLGKGIKRIWIASDAWSVSRTLAKMNGINKLGDIFGFNFITGPMPGFQQYLERLLHNANPVNKFIEEYKNLRCSPEVQQCLLNKSPSQCPLPSSVKSACNMSNFQEDNDDYLTSNVDLKLAYGEKLATWSIAIALRSLLQCNESICSADRNFPPWKLFQELTKINFSMDNGHYYFDNTGAFINGYDLINWARNADERIFKVVGKFNLMENAVEINPHNEIEWENANKTIPVSKCSDSCPPGTQKKLYMVSCCYNCTKCEAGTFSNVSNLENCWKCPIGTWALKGWDHCEKRSDAYFKWNEPFAITIVTSSGIGILLLFAVLIIFLIGRHSAVVKVAGGILCYVMMAGLVMSFCAVVLFVGKPNKHVCRSRQTLYGLGFTLCVSCILVKAYRNFLAFLLDRDSKLKKLYKPPIIIICCTAIQALICTLWLIFDSPKVETLTTEDSMEIMVQCDEGSNWGFGFMLGYIVLLALICFILALKGRKVPQRFKETGYIIFSVAIYIFVWVCFIPVYITKLQQRSGVQAAAIVVSNFGIIFCHFMPKCYMILCKKKTDISTQAYKEKVRVYSIQSTNSELYNMSLDSGEGSMESDDWRINSTKSVTAIHSSDSTTNFVEFPANSFSLVKSLRHLDELRNSSSTLRKRIRTQSL